jgi:hypothetical protein
MKRPNCYECKGDVPDDFLYDDSDEFADYSLYPYYVVEIPSQTKPGSWWEWGIFDTIEEAVEALREKGIPVDDHGNLLLVVEIE